MSIIGQETSKIKIKSTSRNKKKNIEIYSLAILTKKIHIPITMVGKNIKETLNQIISYEIEGKCISEGYIKPNSINILTYSNGVIEGSNINFEIVIECLVCNPVEGMHIACIVKNITKAGIRAQLSEENNPLIIFIARDHNYMSKNFSSVEENQEIKIRVIGQRFELNDTYISVIGELLETKGKLRPKIKLTPQSEEAVLDIPLTILPEGIPVSPVQSSTSISKSKTPKFNENLVISEPILSPTGDITNSSPVNPEASVQIPKSSLTS